LKLDQNLFGIVASFKSSIYYKYGVARFVYMPIIHAVLPFSRNKKNNYEKNLKNHEALYNDDDMSKFIIISVNYITVLK